MPTPRPSPPSQAAEEMLIAKFLKQASPFATLDADRLRQLISQLKRLSVPASDAIVRQGEVGDTCYLLRERPGGGAGARRGERRAQPGHARSRLPVRGGIPAHRRATQRYGARPGAVRAARAAPLRPAVGRRRGSSDGRKDARTAQAARPSAPAPGIQAHHRATATGETITTLKTPSAEPTIASRPGGGSSGSASTASTTCATLPWSISPSSRRLRRRPSPKRWEGWPRQASRKG